MRILIALVIGAALGWLLGSLYPAPRAWLAATHLDALGPRPAIAPSVAAPVPAVAAVAGPTNPVPANPVPANPAPVPGTPSPANHSLPAGAKPETKPARTPVDQATLDQYRAWISAARIEHPYDDSEERMFAVMMCESRGQAGLVNPAGPYSGLFQYGAGMWSGAWNTYRDQSVRDARAQIFATALAWHNHMQRQWGCYSHPH